MGTAHLLHTDANHLLLNLVALALLGWVVEQYSRFLLLLGVLSGMAVVSAWFFLVASTPYYCGWSGVLNTLLPCALYSLYATNAGGSLSSQSLRAHHLVLTVIGLSALAKNFSR